MTRSIAPNRAVGGLLAAGALATVLLSAGCGAGQVSQTADMVSGVTGANSTPGPGNDGTLQLRNVLLAYPGEQGYRADGAATLELRIFNTGQQMVTLVDVSTPAAASVRLRGTAQPEPSSGGPTPSDAVTGEPGTEPTGDAKPSGSAEPGAPTQQADAAGEAGSPADIEPADSGAPVSAGVPARGYVLFTASSSTTIELSGLTAELRAGQSVPVRFTFDNGTIITLDVPVAVPLSPLARSPLELPEGGEGH